MRTIIAGSRTITDYERVKQAIEDSGLSITEVISGGARGVDSLGIRWAAEHDIPHVTLYASWAIHGKAAGPIRNREMAERADALILVWDGRSRGSRNMLEIARQCGLRIHDARAAREGD